MRGATGHSSLVFHAADISIHAPLAGCDIAKLTQTQYIDISIHAPLAGCDAAKSGWRHLTEISIHAPLAGCDGGFGAPACPPTYFNPRTPCGVRLFCHYRAYCSLNISIHAPLAGCDRRFWSACVPSNIFQSTHPLRGATSLHGQTDDSLFISIHAPLAGCDRGAVTARSGNLDFNPRTPCGVRRLKAGSLIVLSLFQSTHPLRGATAKLPKYSRQICAKATKFLQSRTKSGVAACWAKGRRLLFPTLRGANLPGKTGTLPVRIRQSARPLARNRPWHRSAQRAFHTCCRDNKSAGCLFLCP